MIHNVRNGLTGLLFLALPLAACAQQASTALPTAPAAGVVSSVAQSSAPQIVTGLPDFTQLVEQVGPGVVNIEARIAPRQQTARAQMPGDQEMPEIFRRIFGDQFQMPQGPGGQQDPRSPQPRGGGVSMGTGFIVSPDGYVMTNHHVVDGADEVKVKFSDGRSMTAKVVGSDQQYDVALLKLDARNLPSIRLGDSSSLKPGQWVVAIGSPFGLDHSVTAGIVSAVGRSNPASRQQYVPFIQTDVAINQGNSGGPLLNTRGEVVGINSQIFSASGGYMGISFAIPIDLAMGAAEQIKKTGRVSRGQLGVQVGAISEDMAKGLGLPDTRGALINDVLPGSAAEKAGLERGDVIRAVNGTAIASSSDLPPRIGAIAPGSRVTVGILRDGKPRDVSVTLSLLDSDAVAVAQGATPQAPGRAPSAPSEAAALGITVDELDAATGRQLGLEPGAGIRITGVEGRSATEAGLVPGLVILQVGREKVGDVGDFQRLLRGVKPGQVVMLLVRSPRGGTAFAAVTAADKG
ncbi:MAG: Do family serine endopeptidase [Pseudoxanthomonas sp.]|nr:Do family serine endopeptidase [Pseudoxanthomonas sp.]